MIAFLLALAAEAMVLAVFDTPVPVGAVLGAGAAGLFLFRKLRARASEDVY